MTDMVGPPNIASTDTANFCNFFHVNRFFTDGVIFYGFFLKLLYFLSIFIHPVALFEQLKKNA